MRRRHRRPRRCPRLRVCRPAAVRAWQSPGAQPRDRPSQALRGGARLAPSGRRGRGRALPPSKTAAPYTPARQRPAEYTPGALWKQRSLARRPRKLASICVGVALLPSCAQHRRDGSSASEHAPSLQDWVRCIRALAGMRTLVASSSSFFASCRLKDQRCLTEVGVTAGRKRQRHNQRAQQTLSSLRQRSRTVSSDNLRAHAQLTRRKRSSSCTQPCENTRVCTHSVDPHPGLGPVALECLLRLSCLFYPFSPITIMALHPTTNDYGLPSYYR